MTYTQLEVFQHININMYYSWINMHYSSDFNFKILKCVTLLFEDWINLKCIQSNPPPEFAERRVSRVRPRSVRTFHTLNRAERIKEK